MVMEVPGKRRRGRPKRRWLDNIRNNLSERELAGEDGQDRAKWRRLIIKTRRPHIKVGKDAEEEEECLVISTYYASPKLQIYRVTRDTTVGVYGNA